MTAAIEFFDSALADGELVPVEPSAAVAKHRLRKIIPVDREAVPAGRWTESESRWRPLWRSLWAVKPCYRWEVRR